MTEWIWVSIYMIYMIFYIHAFDTNFSIFLFPHRKFCRTDTIKLAITLNFDFGSTLIFPVIMLPYATISITFQGVNLFFFILLNNLFLMKDLVFVVISSFLKKKLHPYFEKRAQYFPLVLKFCWTSYSNVLQYKWTWWCYAPVWLSFILHFLVVVNLVLF